MLHFENHNTRPPHSTECLDHCPGSPSSQGEEELCPAESPRECPLGRDAREEEIEQGWPEIPTKQDWHCHENNLPDKNEPTTHRQPTRPQPPPTTPPSGRPCPLVCAPESFRPAVGHGSPGAHRVAPLLASAPPQRLALISLGSPQVVPPPCSCSDAACCARLPNRILPAVAFCLVLAAC